MRVSSIRNRGISVSMVSCSVQRHQHQWHERDDANACKPHRMQTTTAVAHSTCCSRTLLININELRSAEPRLVGMKIASSGGRHREGARRRRAALDKGNTGIFALKLGKARFVCQSQTLILSLDTRTYNIRFVAFIQHDPTAAAYPQQLHSIGVRVGPFLS